MQRIEGETIARKILRDEEFAKARPLLARNCGKSLPVSMCRRRNCQSCAR